MNERTKVRTYSPAKGFVWNPLLKIPRNSKCPCESGKKFKQCHLKNMPRVLDPHAIPDKPVKVTGK